MKTIKGIMPLQFKYKIVRDGNEVQFFDKLGEDYTDCMRYVYNKTNKRITRYCIGYMKNNIEEELIAMDIPMNIKRIEKIIYADHYNRN